MVELIDDDLCDAIACAGTAGEVREKVRSWEGVADRVLVAGPWYGPSPERMIENDHALVETFSKSSLQTPRARPAHRPQPGRPDQAAEGAP
jgi:hypothetical protein